MPPVSSLGQSNPARRDMSVDLSTDRGSSVHWGQKGMPVAGRSASVVSSSVDEASSESSRGPMAVRRFASMSATLPDLETSLDSQQDSGEVDSAVETLPQAQLGGGGEVSLQSLGLQFGELQDEVAACKERFSESLKKAEAANVYPAKRSFWQKAVGVGINLGAVFLFAGLSLATGGVGPLVGLGVAGVMAAKSAADTRCAYKDMKNKMAKAEGKAPPYAEQPLGGDVIGNVLYRRFLSSAQSSGQPLSQSELDGIKERARQWSLGLNIGLKVVAFSAGGIAGMAANLGVTARLACIGLSVGALGFSVALDMDKRKLDADYKKYGLANMPQHYEKLCDVYQKLAQDERAQDLTDLQRQRLTTELSAAYLALHQDVQNLQASMQEKLAARSNQPAEAQRGMTHGLTEGAVDLMIAGVRRTAENVGAIGLKAMGANVEAASTLLSALKTQVLVYRMLDRVEQRTEPLVRHAEQIVDLRDRMQWMAV